MATWQEVVAFSQSLTIAADKPEVVVSTPTRFANILRVGLTGQREMVSVRWGFAGKGDIKPSRPKHMYTRGETIDSNPTFAQALFSYFTGDRKSDDRQEQP